MIKRTKKKLKRKRSNFMSVSGDASEQVVRLSLEGFEVLAKLTGSGAKNIAAMLYTIMKDNKQTKGN